MFDFFWLKTYICGACAKRLVIQVKHMSNNSNMCWQSYEMSLCIYRLDSMNKDKNRALFFSCQYLLCYWTIFYTFESFVLNNSDLSSNLEPSSSNSLDVVECLVLVT